MKIVVVGAGKVGFTLAAQLTKEQHDIVLIDNDREVVKQIDDALDILVLTGNGASLDMQREAGVETADLLIAVTPTDELNLMCCVLARKLGCRNTIARIRNPEYSEQIYFLRDELGLSMSVNPERDAAREIYRLMQIPGFLKRDAFSKGRVEIVEIVVSPDCAIDGISLVELNRMLKVRVLVCAIDRGGKVCIPDGSFVLRAGDKIYVTAPVAALTGLLHSIGMRSRKTRNALIIGGGRIAQSLIGLLLQSHTHVKVIESDRHKCEQLAEDFPGAEILHADGSSQSVLQRENIEQMDTVVTLTGIDEENLIISMYANHIGVPQVITKLNRTEYNELFSRSGVECVVSPKQLCAQNIIRYVRSIQNSGEGSVLSVHHLVNGQVEALEFNVAQNCRGLNRTLTEIRLKPNILIACINRMGKVIIPGGSDTLSLGDIVIVVATADRILYDLNDIFAEDTP